MPTRRTVLTAASAGLTTLHSASALDGVCPHAVTANDIAALVKRSEESNAALMRGDIAQYRSLVSISGDFTLMSPFGGKPTRGADLSDERMEAMGRFFRNGTLQQELIQSYGVKDMIVLAITERAHVEVGGLAAQDWALRVTLVYRRETNGWLLVHRHADPLVAGINLEQAAIMARAPRSW